MENLSADSNQARLHARDARRLSDSLLGTVFDVAQVGIFCIDDAGIFVRVNPAFCTLTGYAEAEIQNQPYTLIAPPEIVPIAERFLRALLTDSAKLPSEWRIRRKDQQFFDVLVSHKAVSGTDGRQFAVVTFSDISARRAAQAEAHRLNLELESRVATRTRELEIAKARYEALVDSAHEAIFIVYGGQMHFANFRAAELLRTTPDKLIGRPAMSFVHPDDHARGLEFGRMMLSDTARSVRHHSIEVRFVPDGATADEEHWAVMYGTLVPWAEGTGMLWCADDITEKRGLEAAARRSAEQYRTVVENANEAILIAQDHVIRFANARVERMLRRDRESLLGTRTLDLIHPDDRGLARERRSAMYAGEHVPPFEARFLRGPQSGEEDHTIDPLRQTAWGEIFGVQIDWGGAPALLLFINDITERKRLQGSLAASLNEREAILETSAVGICLLKNRRHSWVNQTMTRILGYTSDELLGRETRIHYPSDADFERTGMAAYLAIQNNGSWTGEAQMRRKDGTLIWVQLHGKRVGSGTTEEGTVWTYVDITDRKQMVEALATSEYKYRQIVERASEAILVGDRERGIRYCNAEFLRLNRLTQSEAIGMSLMDLVYPEDRDLLMDAMVKRLSPEGRKRTWLPVEIRARFSTPQAEVWHALNGVPVMWDGTASILMFANDVTERRRLQEDVRKSFAHRDAILKTTSVGICYFSNRRFTWVNDAIIAMTGYSMEEMLGNDASFVYADPEDYKRIGTEGYPQIFATGSYDLECQLNTKDGGRIWTRLTGRAINRERVTDGTIWTVVDLSREKRAEADIKAALAKERELSELKTRFVSMTSHEFRTPLATILSSAELIEHYGDRFEAAEKKEILTDIQTAAKRMTSMLEDVLTLGKADAGKVPCVRAPLDLEELCRRCIAEVQMSAGAGHHMLFDRVTKEKEFNRAAPLDEKLLRHILTNLLTNACKYTPQGGRVDVSLSDVQTAMQITVRDTGIGIPPEDQPRLFESFHRAQNVGNIPGTGLGLAIVKRSVTAHSGEIVVKSVPGEGSEFVVTIPYY